jgi:hypothetical protein
MHQNVSVLLARRYPTSACHGRQLAAIATRRMRHTKVALLLPQPWQAGGELRRASGTGRCSSRCDRDAPDAAHTSGAPGAHPAATVAGGRRSRRASGTGSLRRLSLQLRIQRLSLRRRPSRPSVRASRLRRPPRLAAFDLLIGILACHPPTRHRVRWLSLAYLFCVIKRARRVDLTDSHSSTVKFS